MNDEFVYHGIHTTGVHTGKCTGYSKKYYDIVDKTIDKIEKAKPNIFNSVKNIIDNIVENLERPDTNSNQTIFSLLHGLVQSGKSPAQMVILWIIHRKYHYNIVYITKKLNSIKEDIVGKFSSDYINKYIVEACKESGYLYHNTIAEKYFSLKPVCYEKANKINLVSGCMPIILMQKHNYQALIDAYFNSLTATRPAPILFVIDEVHEMYTNLESFYKIGGLSSIIDNQKETTKITNHHILSWLIKKSVEKKSFVLGVTATPYAAMSCDPFCFPRKVYNLIADPPFDNAVYYGYSPVLQQLDNVIIDFHYNDIATTVNKILNRPRKIVKDAHEIPVILIMNEHNIASHKALCNLLKELFKTRLHCLTFNSGNDADNSESLKDFFTEQSMTHEICMNGGFCLIGKQSLNTGVTVKPTKLMQKKINGMNYSINGITDQLISEPSESSSLTSEMQKMRLFGWYPKDHTSILWIPNEQFYSLYNNGLINADREFSQKFNSERGPESVKNITFLCKLQRVVKGSSAEDPYRVSSKMKLSFILKHGIGSIEEAEIEEIETTFVKIDSLQIDDPEIDLNARICDYSTSNKNDNKILAKKQKKLRACIITDNDKSQIPYSNDRFNQIIKAVVQPKDDTQWQVNEFLFGKDQSHTLIKDCYRVTFKDDWETRALNGQIISKGDSNKFFFQVTPDTYIIVGYEKHFEHKHLDNFNKIKNISDFPLEHQQSLDDIDKLWNQIVKGEKKLTSWTLFMKSHKIAKGNGGPGICSEPYAKFKKDTNGMLLLQNILNDDSLDVTQKANDFAKVIELFYKNNMKIPNAPSHPIKIKITNLPIIRKPLANKIPVTGSVATAPAVAAVATAATTVVAATTAEAIMATVSVETTAAGAASTALVCQDLTDVRPIRTLVPVKMPKIKLPIKNPIVLPQNKDDDDSEIDCTPPE